MFIKVAKRSMTWREKCVKAKTNWLNTCDSAKSEFLFLLWRTFSSSLSETTKRKSRARREYLRFFFVFSHFYRNFCLFWWKVCQWSSRVLIQIPKTIFNNRWSDDEPKNNNLFEKAHIFEESSVFNLVEKNLGGFLFQDIFVPLRIQSKNESKS